MTTKTVKKVCECKNCGNESEMEFSCTYIDTTDEETSSPEKPKENKAKGTATCSNCGNEADMWIDL